MRSIKKRARKSLQTSALAVPSGLAEVHFYPITLPTSAASISSTWMEIDVSAITRGTEVTQRIGRTIRCIGFDMNSVISTGANQTAADDAFNVVRVVLGVYTAGSTTPLTDAGAGLNNYISALSYTRGRLVRLLWDQLVPLQVACLERAGGDGYTPCLKTVSTRIKFGQLISWGSADDYPNFRVILSFISDSSAVVNPGFVAGFARMVFIDV